MSSQPSTLAPTGGRPAEKVAACPHYPDCVGCPYIGIRYGEQLRRKREIVTAALASYPSLAQVQVPPVVGSPRAFGYRNQVKLVARRARRGLLLGIYRPGTHQIVDIGCCPVHHPLIAATVARCRVVFERHNVTAYDERTGTGWLRYLVVRAAAWQKSVQITLVVRDRTFAAEREVVRDLRRIAHVRGVLLNLNPERGNAIFGATFVPLVGESTLVERVAGLTLQVHAGAFVQANIAAARRVYDRVLAWTQPESDATVVDLYAGVGAISLLLGTHARRVFGIEESPLAVLDAKANIRRNGFHNVRFLAGPVAEVLPALIERIGRVDAITLNPPRHGVDDRARAAMVAAAPGRIVYASCDPSTLARDLDWLAQHGYCLDALQPFDLLPQTEHVECVAAVSKASAGSAEH